MNVHVKMWPYVCNIVERDLLVCCRLRHQYSSPIFRRNVTFDITWYSLESPTSYAYGGVFAENNITDWSLKMGDLYFIFFLKSVVTGFPVMYVL